MTLTMRRIIALGLIGTIFLAADILVVANWPAEKEVAEKGWLAMREIPNRYCHRCDCGSANTVGQPQENP